MRILTALGVVEPSTGDVIVNTEIASLIISVVFASRSVVPSNIICVPSFAYNLVVCITVGAILDTEELLDEPIVVGAVIGAAELLDEPIPLNELLEEPNTPGKPELLDEANWRADELEEPMFITLTILKLAGN